MVVEDPLSILTYVKHAVSAELIILECRMCVFMVSYGICCSSEDLMHYGIAIRTLGNAGEKYQMLMKSILSQTIQPTEVLVILPYGYPFPESNLEMVKYAYAKKGMMSQRISSVEQSSCEFILLLDDDVCFQDDFVERLAEPVFKGMADISFPIYEALLPKKGLDEIMSIMLLRAWPSSGKAYTRITSTAGFTYRRSAASGTEPVPAESAPGMCLFVRRSAITNAKLRDELWVDKPVYSLKDDAVFVYKAFLCGAKVFGIPGLEIKHLDAGSVEGKERKMRRAYAYAFNTVVFWRRLIIPFRKSALNKAVACLAIAAWIFLNGLFYLVRGIVDKRFITFVKGISDGFKEPMINWELK
jgi:GT2 family glycosyltransferase